jgi:transaldolase/glucose-6-phosphate isomerase
MATLMNEIVNPLQSVVHYGQSIWLDYIRRSLITSGELKRLIDEDGLRGVTSNPAIFEKAILGSTDYQEFLNSPVADGLDAKALYEQLAIRDIQDAADILLSVYRDTNARDGYVSLEVSPLLAHDARGTLEEARRLWKSVNRPNLMIKVPATVESIPVIRQLIGEGVNVNVTLLFSQDAYEQVAEAYISGLEDRCSTGADISNVASVASFFVSRIDAAVDSLLLERIKVANASEAPRLKGLLGKVAIANAKLTYERFEQIFGSARWKRLENMGAQNQRLLWASTGTKNPNYRDVVYVEELIGADTVNTIPPATYNAFREHGRPSSSLTHDLETAHETMAALDKYGISMRAVTDQLLGEGIQQFVTAFTKLLAATSQKASRQNSATLHGQTCNVAPTLLPVINESLEEWRKSDKVRRLWQGDSSLWTGSDENRWLGWLGITDDQLAHIKHLSEIAREVKAIGFKHALLLGMGGSSLCPEVLRQTFGTVPGFPDLKILDSTDPSQVVAVESSIDLAETVFIVSSKSGGTLEPNIFKQHFFERAKQVVGEKEAGKRFIAITDPGSTMQHVAEGDKFQHIFFGHSNIGGRYSALSDFGMVPAAIMGLDVPKFLGIAEEMVHACSPTVPISENPGVVLGTILGVLAKQGRDKVTIVASPGIKNLGAWLEQLLAESTGKDGKGLIPVDGESLGDPDKYGDDRIFIYLSLGSARDARQEAQIERLERAGQPIVRIDVPDIYHLGAEFFRWEIATAVAGSILGINAFNQPDVEASKIATRKLTSEYERAGSLPSETPLFEGDGIRLFADARNAAELTQAVGRNRSVTNYLKAHLARLGKGDYFALLAYLEMNGSNAESLQKIRHAVRDRRTVATCLGFGPRFLHSTGQAYKGGPNSGVFLQLTCDDALDVPVPEQKYTFGVVKAAQARGDFQVLADRQRRALRVHLSGDVSRGLDVLLAAINQAV